jgi:hypothetical protein
MRGGQLISFADFNQLIELGGVFRMRQIKR